MDFSRDGRLLLTVSGDDTVRLWDVENGQVTWSLDRANASRAFFAVDDAQIALVGRDRQISVYRLEDRTLVRAFEGIAGNVGPAAVSPDGRLLALGAEDGTVAVWDLAGERRAFVLAAHIFPVRGVYFSPDSTLLATVSAERAVRLWDMASGETRAILADFDQRPYVAAFSPDSGQVAVGLTGQVRTWATADGALLRTITTASRAAIRQLAFTADGRLLGGGEQDAVSIWDAVTGEQLAGLPDHGPDFHDMALNPAGDLLVTVARPGRTFLWDMSNPNQRVQLSAEADEISLAGWTADGRVLILAAADGALHFWGIPGEPLTADR